MHTVPSTMLIGKEVWSKKSRGVYASQSFRRQQVVVVIRDGMKGKARMTAIAAQRWYHLGFLPFNIKVIFQLFELELPLPRLFIQCVLGFGQLRFQLGNDCLMLSAGGHEVSVRFVGAEGYRLSIS